MSKIRIYELAKELGVDNKVIINRLNELGIGGKSSHSHSLESDEADAIRRAIIRQAMGAPKVASSEVVTRRVDRSTGSTDTVVERRQGDVIRRRRQADVAEPAVVAQPIPQGPSSLEAAGPSALAEDRAQHGIAEGVAARAFPVEALEEVAETPVEVAEVGAGAPEVVVAEVAPQEAEEVQPPVAPLSEDVVEADAVREAAPAAVESSVEPEYVSAAPAEVKAPSVVEPQKPAIGPKILGRIELPQRRVVVKPVEVKRPVKGGLGRVATPVVEVEEESGPRKGAKKGRKREVTSLDVLEQPSREGRRGRSKGGRGGADDRRAPLSEADKPKVAKRVIELGDSITVGELAKQMSLKAGEVIAKLFGLGILATINQAIDKDTAAIVADELGYEVKHTEFREQDIIQDVVTEEEGNLQPRPPVVTVMGHVDHGKTSLLDRIRSTTVAAMEAGGITQHIGAYSVTAPDGRSITFIDTPGHAAFTAMRARGAQVTDIVILVVAADDGVMPQTREAISHAQAAKVPIIVAVNKMDRPDANPDRVKQQLAELGLQPEDWGGDTMFFPVSALKGAGITELLEGVLVLAEVQELRANPDRRAKGTIIESRQDRGRGVVATVLVQAGTLRIGDVFVSGSEYGRVRTMNDYRGERLTSAGPATPVEITGLNGSPESGDDFIVMDSDADAREVAGNRAQRKEQQERALASGPISLEEFAKRASNQAAQELNIILKADVAGSVEAVRHAVEQLSGEKVKVRVLHAAVGGVTESDIQLAIASKAIVVGFGVRAEPRATADAEVAGVEIRFYRVIYELLDDVKKAMVGLLEPIKQESFLGRVEVRETFTVPKIGTIAGCYVTGGVVRRNAFGRLLRDNRVVHEGKLGSLRRFKDDVKEVQAGFECGIGLENFNDVKIGDVVEVFEYKEVAPTLE
jgi:translation initiation factor IF-2